MAQAPTRLTSIKTIVKRPHFRIGFNDRKWKSNFHVEYETWDKQQQWTYERGRLVAALFPSARFSSIDEMVNLYKTAKDTGALC